MPRSADRPVQASSKDCSTSGLQGRQALEELSRFLERRLQRKSVEVLEYRALGR
ncbi:MAG TPA: hypothetical protein VIE42_07680 [Steroidobacteraceae bacterium]